MELIMISTTKLKVMLSAEDMKKLDFDPCGGGDISGRAAFRNILKEAREKCGFDAMGDRVFVQYYPEKHGGCEMFVTKLVEGEKIGGCRKSSADTLNKAGDRFDGGYIIYSFDVLHHLLSTCSMLKRSGYSGDSLAYRMSDGRREYYLLLEEETFFAPENCGVRCRAPFFHILLEHGHLICENAVNSLGDLG